MGKITFGVPQRFALALRDAMGYQTFIETGTYKGGTAQWAAGHFTVVHTLEGDAGRHIKTRAAIGDKCPNITFHHGDSRTKLAGILKAVNAPALLWLDAHWMGFGRVEAYEANDECPLREELAAVLADRWAADHAILIDDARLFTGGLPEPFHAEQWPGIGEIVETLLPGRALAVYADVIAAVPIRAAPLIERWKRGLYD